MISIFDTGINATVDNLKPGTKCKSIAVEKDQQHKQSESSHASKKTQSKKIQKMPNSDKKGKPQRSR